MGSKEIQTLDSDGNENTTLSSVVLVVIGPTVARLWVGEAPVPPLSLFIALGIWTIYLTSIVQYSHMLMVAERVRLLAGLGLVLAAVNLAASIILTQQFGLVGPVLGNLVAACSVQLVPMIVMTRRFMRESSLRRARTRRSLLPNRGRAKVHQQITELILGWFAGMSALHRTHLSGSPARTWLPGVSGRRHPLALPKPIY